MPVGPATTNNIFPKPLPVEIRRAPGSGLEKTPGLEDDHVDTGQFWSTD